MGKSAFLWALWLKIFSRAVGKYPNIMNKIEIELYYREWQEAKERLLKEISMKEPVRRIVSALALPKKYTGSFALIPANLDLDRHLERFPVTDYFFVTTFILNILLR